MISRTAMVSSAEHTLAVAALATDTYTAEEYMEAVEHVRATGRAERYADHVLGITDVDELLRGVEGKGETIVRAAEAKLRSRGIDPATASYAEYADALVQVSP